MAGTGREQTLQFMYAAFKKTGIHFLSLYNGRYAPAGPPDDSGYFLYVSQLSSYLNVNALMGATLFFNFFIFFTIGITFLSFFFLSSTIVGVVVIFLGFVRLMMPLLYLNNFY